MEKITLDHSRRACAHACLQKYYWQYIRNIEPDTGSSALRYHRSWHAALSALYSYVQEVGWKDFDIMMAVNQVVNAAAKDFAEETEKRQYDDDYRSLGNLLDAFLGYLDRFSSDRFNLEVLAVDEPFTIEFTKFYFTGKLDLRIMLNQRHYLMEYKTTGAHLSQAAKRLDRDSQCIGHHVVCKKLGIDIQGLLISTHHITARKTKEGAWGKPKIDFTRIHQQYTEKEHIDWEEMFTFVAEAIQNSITRDHWPKNYDSCYSSGVCPYRKLCEQHRSEST